MNFKRNWYPIYDWCFCLGWPSSESDDGRESARFNLRNGGRSGQADQGDQGGHRTASQAPRAVRGPRNCPA